MKEKIAKFVLVALGMVGMYHLVVFMGCWTQECFAQPFHKDAAIFTAGFALFMWALGVIMEAGFSKFYK